MNKLEENIIDFNHFDEKNLDYFRKIYNSNLINFNNLIDKISDLRKVTPEWCTQTIISRNNYISNIYFDYCKLEVLKKNLNKKNLNHIFVNNNLQKKIIFENFNTNYKIKFSFKNKKSESNFFKRLKNFLFNIKFSLVLFANKSHKRKKNFLDKEKIILIENFLYKDKFIKESYQDRFYGKLLNYLDINQKKKIFFLFQNPNIFKTRKNLEVLEKYKINFITIFDFLKFTDYLKALVKSQMFFFSFPKKINFNKFELTELFKDLFSSTNNDVNCFHGILQFLFFERLNKEIKNKKILKVIDWYENQSLDKGFNLGLNTFFPYVEKLGYQPFAVDFNFYSHLIPTKKEIANDLTPNKIAFMGKETKKYLIKKFKLNRSNFILSPSLRYEALFKKFEKRRNKNIKNVLVGLPISYQDSNDILKIVKKFFEKYQQKNLKFFVNYHPMLNFKKLIEENKSLYKKINLINGPFSQIHKNFDCVISNSSSLCLEALALSIPVIIVKNSSGITQNPISIIKENTWKLISNPDELKNAINLLLFVKKKSVFLKNSKKIKDNYFTMVNSKTVKKFLEFK